MRTPPTTWLNVTAVVAVVAMLAAARLATETYGATVAGALAAVVLAAALNRLWQRR